MRALLAFLLTFAFASFANGQIYEIQFKSEKIAAKYSKYMMEVNGVPRFLGEYRSGITWNDKRNSTIPAGVRSEWFVANSSDPTKLPYKVKDGARGKAVKKQVVTIPNEKIQNIQMFMDNNSFYGLSLEYQDRIRQLDQLRDQRDEFEKGGKDWKSAHWQLLDAYEGMIGWLSSTGYSGAIKKIKKESDRQRKVVAEAAEEERRKRAIQDVGEVEVASELNQSCEKLGLKVRFKKKHSQHFIIYYNTKIKDVQIEHCLKLAERALGGFRAKFVEPCLDENFPDLIPEGQWIEWHFGPDDLEAHEKLLEEHYGLSWGARKEERLKSKGTRVHRGGEYPLYLCYWRIGQGSDLHGIVANNLGVHLAKQHYRSNYTQVPIDWIEQAVGYWISLEFLGRNSVTERSFDWGEEEGGTVSRRKDDKKEKETVADPVLAIGERRLYLEGALAEGVPLSVLMQTRLFDMKRGDVAKSWAMYDFLTKTYGRDAHIFLRSMGNAAREGGPFQEKLREIGDPLFETKGKDLFRMLDEAWKEWAQKQLGR
jgi:hypothetical protein